MNSWRDCSFQKQEMNLRKWKEQDLEIDAMLSRGCREGLNMRLDFCQDQAAVDTSHTPSVMQDSGAPHLDETDQPSRTRIFGTENRKPKTDMTMDEMLQLKESCSSLHNQDYVEKIKEIQSYVDMVKRFTRPGCSAESLDVALRSMSSLFNTLSAMSSKQNIIHASL